MTRKTSIYSRKRRQAGTHRTFNGAAWMNAIQQCSTYGESPDLPGFFSTEDAMERAMQIVRQAVAGLLAHELPPEPERDHDILAHALGVATIRLVQIHPDLDSNPALPVIKRGNDAVVQAIERHERTGQWGLDATGRSDLVAAIEVYEEVVRNSSPAQMAKATDERIKILAGKTRMPIEVARRGQGAAA